MGMMGHLLLVTILMDFIEKFILI